MTKRRTSNKNADILKPANAFLISVIFAIAMIKIVLEPSTTYNMILIFTISIVVCLITIELWNFVNFELHTLPYGIVMMDTLIINQIHQFIRGVVNPDNTLFLIFGTLVLFIISSISMALLLLLKESKFLE